jgi:hypothetical protein
VALVSLLLCAAAPAQAMSSGVAKNAVRKAVMTRYDVPERIAVRCRRGNCKVTFRQRLSTCVDNSVRVTNRKRVKNLSPDCFDDTTPPPLPGAGTPPPDADGPPPLPDGPPPPPSASQSSLAHTSQSTLAHTSQSDNYIWKGYGDPYQVADYPGYWFLSAVWSDNRRCEAGAYMDYYAIYYWNGSQWTYWYDFWQDFYFAEVHMTDPCLGG